MVITMKKFKNNSGLSLIDLQFAVVIGFITLIAALSLYIFYWHAFVSGNSMLDVYSNSRVALELISRDTRSASQVATSYTSGVTYTTGDNVLVLMIPAIDAAHNVIPSKYDYIIYQLQGGKLYRIVFKDPDSIRLNENRVVADYCTSLTFSYNGTTLSNVPNKSIIDNIDIYLPINKTTLSLSGQGQEVSSMNPTTIVKLRNK